MDRGQVDPGLTDGGQNAIPPICVSCGYDMRGATSNQVRNAVLSCYGGKLFNMTRISNAPSTNTRRHLHGVAAAPGRETRYDHEYRRNGVANLFMIFEPLGGKRHVKVTERRTKKDWAKCVREMVDEMYPAAERIVLVMDNLNTHTPASLYGAFAPDEAKRIADKLEIHYTPKHGSRLDMAEIELGILGRQCLDRRIDDAEELTREVAAWEAERNASKAKANWGFSTPDARIKLRKLYPSFDG